MTRDGKVEKEVVKSAGRALGACQAARRALGAC